MAHVGSVSSGQEGNMNHSMILTSKVLRATCIANPISIAFAFEAGLQMLHEEPLTAAISSSVGAKGRMFKS